MPKYNRTPTTGYRNVYNHHCGKFRVMIKHDYNLYYKGGFLTKEEANLHAIQKREEFKLKY